MEHVDTELHEAVRFGDTNLVESALNDGLDPNAIGIYQWSPMHEAACNGDIDILKLLLEAKGNPNASDNLHGCTATHYAAKENHTECLQLLVDYGGRYDVTNNDGETPMDMAEGKCKQILEIQSTGDYITQTLRTARQSTFDNYNSTPNLYYHSMENVSQKDRHPEKTDKDTPQRTGTPTLTHTASESGTPHSISPPPRTSTPTAWDNIEVFDSNDTVEAGTGLLQMSFEYNSNKSILKIRVWQVEDLLLPPVEFANINRIYIKSRLLPDKKGESKRRTEEHRIDDQMKMKNSLVTLKRKKARDSFKAIFLPCAFKFSKPLEYKKITKDIVASSTVHIDVCVKQKYSTKSFPIANIQMPLKSAVRKLRKTFHQLHPCINYTMPDNIHVYDPKDLVIVTEGMYSNTIVSQPNLRALSRHTLRDEKQRRTNSDINLRAVRTQSVESIPAAIIDVPEEGEDTEDNLREISIMDNRNGVSGLSRSDSNVTIVQMGETSLPGSTDDELEEVTVVKPRKKLSQSSPDVTVIDVKESDETSFIKRKPNRLKLNRPSTPPKDKVESLEIKVEAVPGVSQSVKPKVKEHRTKQAADDLQQVKVETPRKNFQRKSKEQFAFIELDNLEEQRSRLKARQRIQRSPSPSGRVSAPTMRVTKAVSPPIRLSVPEIRVVDTDGNIEPTTVVTIVKDQTSRQKPFYKKRKAPEAPKPGRVVDLRQQKGGHQEVAEDEVEISPRSSSAHEEELIIGQNVGASEKTKVGYAEVTELDSRYGGAADSKTNSEFVVEPGHNRRVRKPPQLTETSGYKNSSKNSEPDIPLTKRVVGKPQYVSQDPQQRTKSPKSLNQGTTFTIRQQEFHQSLTQGMMHTELYSASASSGKISPKSPCAYHSRSPDTAQQVHYETETPDVSPRLSRHKKQSYQKGPAIKGPSQKVSSSVDADIELIVDPAQLATPEFKLKAFQRTSKDPHPSTPFLHKTESKVGLNDTQLERVDPFFVPGTPLQSPVSQLGSPAQVKTPLMDRSPSPDTRRRRMGVDQNRVVSSDQPKIRDKSSPKSKVKSETSLMQQPLLTDLRSKVTDQSPSPGQRMWTSSGTGQSDKPGVGASNEIGSMRKERSRSPGGAGKIAVSHGEKNNNGVQGKSQVTPIANPAVTKIKQSWF